MKLMRLRKPLEFFYGRGSIIIPAGTIVTVELSYEDLRLDCGTWYTIIPLLAREEYLDEISETDFPS